MVRKSDEIYANLGLLRSVTKIVKLDQNWVINLLLECICDVHDEYMYQGTFKCCIQEKKIFDVKSLSILHSNIKKQYIPFGNILKL